MDRRDYREHREHREHTRYDIHREHRSDPRDARSRYYPLQSTRYPEPRYYPPRHLDPRYHQKYYFSEEEKELTIEQEKIENVHKLYKKWETQELEEILKNRKLLDKEWLAYYAMASIEAQAAKSVKIQGIGDSAIAQELHKKFKYDVKEAILALGCVSQAEKVFYSDPISAEEMGKLNTYQTNELTYDQLNRKIISPTNYRLEGVLHLKSLKGIVDVSVRPVGLIYRAENPKTLLIAFNSSVRLDYWKYSYSLLSTIAGIGSPSEMIQLLRGKKISTVPQVLTSFLNLYIEGRETQSKKNKNEPILEPSIQEQIYDYIIAKGIKSNEYRLVIAGYHMGAVLAILTMLDLRLSLTFGGEFSLYTFGSPKFGTRDFGENFYNAMNPYKAINFINQFDDVAELPESPELVTLDTQINFSINYYSNNFLNQDLNAIYMRYFTEFHKDDYIRVLEENIGLIGTIYQINPRIFLSADAEGILVPPIGTKFSARTEPSLGTPKATTTTPKATTTTPKRPTTTPKSEAEESEYYSPVSSVESPGKFRDRINKMIDKIGEMVQENKKKNIKKSRKEIVKEASQIKLSGIDE